MYCAFDKRAERNGKDGELEERVIQNQSHQSDRTHLSGITNQGSEGRICLCRGLNRCWIEELETWSWKEETARFIWFLYSVVVEPFIPFADETRRAQPLSSLFKPSSTKPTNIHQLQLSLSKRLHFLFFSVRLNGKRTATELLLPNKARVILLMWSSAFSLLSSLAPCQIQSSWQEAL